MKWFKRLFGSNVKSAQQPPDRITGKIIRKDVIYDTDNMDYLTSFEAGRGGGDEGYEVLESIYRLKSGQWIIFEALLQDFSKMRQVTLVSDDEVYQRLVYQKEVALAERHFPDRLSRA